ncbi:MAG: hypothetical protein HN742_02990 [Lentisphaerae bacterium]|jgi:hypothetical protein|nr:hypothetical protein [Lentisphaerota bacterium]MBT4814918.1 hypothetical protein [Lentisphaerota bacterium]MBT5605435.1 hypothetical protein [Lentisphaerota bacterium]MBT7060134.1 hypothetical protein [Lentisphaerota bacterium]MBT7840806.1 hypothetical protein [Lentisphaerota bacterium]
MTGNSRQRLLSVAAVACLALLVADRTILQPLLRSCRERSARIRVLEAELAQAEHLSGQAEAWQTRLQEFGANALPGGTSAAESVLITAARRWADKTRLQLSATRPRWTDADGDQPRIFELRITAAGTLEAVARFLYEVETSPMPLRVANLTIASTSSNPRHLTLTVDVCAVLWSPDTPAKGDAS